MHTVPLALAIILHLSVIAATVAAYQYWDRHPEKAQAAVGRVLRPIWRGLRLSYRIARWPITLVISWAIVLGMMPVYTFGALAYVLLSKVAGQPAKITVKFA